MKKGVKMFSEEPTMPYKSRTKKKKIKKATHKHDYGELHKTKWGGFDVAVKTCKKCGRVVIVRYWWGS